MRKFLYVMSAAFILSLGISASSQAATASFDLTGSGGLQSSYTFTDGTLNMVATATNQIPFLPSPLNGEFPADVGQSSHGLGVVGIPLGDPYQVDGLLSIERLYLNFNPDVHVTSITMTLVDRNDDADLIIPGPTTYTYHLATYGSPTATIPNADLPSGKFSQLIVSTGDPGILSNDDFAVSAITVCYDRANGPVVPLPSSVLGGIALLVGGGLFRGIRRWKMA